MNPSQSSQTRIKPEVIDIEAYFGDGELEITSHEKTPGRKPEVIEIIDDDEIMLIDPPTTSNTPKSPAASSPRKKKRRDENGKYRAGSSRVIVEEALKPDSDSEGSIDYDTWIGADKTVKMEVDEDEGQPAPNIVDQLVDDVKSDERLMRERQPVKITEKFMSRPGLSRLPNQRASRFPRLWNSFDTKSLNLQPRRPNETEIPFTSPSARNPHIWNPKRRTVFHSSLTIPSLRVVERFKKTSGQVTKIAQSNGLFAVASGACGGNADPPFDPDDPHQERPVIDPYNVDGNLIMWTGREFYKVKAHERTWVVPSRGQTSPSQGQTKVYTVNDVAFDPLKPTRLVSSGNDCTLRIWDTSTTIDSSFEIQQTRLFNYRAAPNDIVFKPRSSMFAVGCYDGFVYIHRDSSNDDRVALRVADKSSRHRTGTFLWGGDREQESGRLHNMLFTSSEGDDDGEVYRHVAFDVEQSKAAYTFSCNENGETMALDDRSETLAIATVSFGGGTLSLYDIPRHDGRRPISQIALTKSRPTTAQPIEHTSASFSPDGILLALGRSDNVALVYDVRFLSKSDNARPVARYQHPSKELAANYGITDLKWVEGFDRGSLGLLTAGSDGCVRLWDAAQAPRSEADSTIIAELNHDIAYFSLGDTAKGEHRLVVADCGGDVYVYD